MEPPAGRLGVVPPFQRRLVSVSALCVLAALASAYATGSIHLPHNDDWAYFRVLFHFAETGEVRLVGMNEMMLLGQLAATLPLVWIFGPSITAVNVAAALVSGIALYATGSVARRFLEPRPALFVVMLVAVFPGFGVLVTTFMTDNPSYAAQMCCVSLALWAFTREGARRHALVIVALAVGVFAFSIREFAASALVAVIAGYAVAERRSGRPVVRPLAALVLTGGVCFVLYELRHTLEGDVSHFFGRAQTLTVFTVLSQALFTLSLGIAPALLLTVRRRAPRVTDLGLAAAMVTALALLAIRRTEGNPVCCLNDSGSVFTGNLLSPRGPLNNLVLFGERPVLFPTPAWICLMVVGVAAAAWLIALAVERLTTRAPGPLLTDPAMVTLTTLALGTVALIGVRVGLGGPLFDRYLTVLVAVAAIFLLRGLPWDTGASTGGVVAAAAMGVVTLGLITTGHAFDVARWAGGELAVRSGISEDDVDAGYEWVGYHYEGVANEPLSRRSVTMGPGYMNVFPRAGNCGLVAAAPQTGPAYVPLGKVVYSQWFGMRRQYLWVYRHLPACQLAAP